MTIPFNKARAKEFAASKSMAEGRHALLCVEAGPHSPKDESNANIMAKLVFKKLMDPTSADSAVDKPTVSLWLTLPLDNPEVQGHEAPQWSGRMWAQNMAAFFGDEVPEYPRFDKDSKTTTFQGEVLAKTEDIKAAQMQCLVAAGEKATELWGEGGDGLGAFVGCVVYGEVSYKKDNKTGVVSDMPSVDNLHAECPEDWELTGEVVQKIAADSETEEAPVAKKPAKKGKR